MAADDLQEKEAVLRWAEGLEDLHDDPRVRLSNEAARSYLAGTGSRRALKSTAYVANDLPYTTPGEVMAYFAALMALESHPSRGLFNEASSKAEEMGAPQEPGWEPGVDASSWSPLEGDAEMAEWESILGRRAAR